MWLLLTASAFEFFVIKVFNLQRQGSEWFIGFVNGWNIPQLSLGCHRQMVMCRYHAVSGLLLMDDYVPSHFNNVCVCVYVFGCILYNGIIVCWFRDLGNQTVNKAPFKFQNCQLWAVLWFWVILKYLWGILNRSSLEMFLISSLSLNVMYLK